ncbi:hypothetical protein [Romboutsia sp. 13368]|uniref:hypothetical protein n=1 Tax=Romboutsia sp. 13368 TaxID=2708053 RepID=UPI0025DA1417|nr:hypothetical protein [Romboutsia sp. 13368]
MKNNLNYLKNNLNLYGYTLLKVTNNKILIFKSFYKYTKCIYISSVDTSIEVKIDKVFDSQIYPEYIERLMITKRCFDSIYDSLKYIQRNIIV